MSDPVAFLAARLDEDEATATRAAECDKLRMLGAERGLPPGDWSWLADYGQPQPGDIALIDHQVRFDPARELREVAAKRRLIERYKNAVAAVTAGSVVSFRAGQDDGYAQACLDAIRDATAAWADHPDYDQEWAPT